MEENNLLLVLLLDDAGTVAPGLLHSLRQFAESHPALRLVYSMNPEDSLIMDAGGSVVGDCRFVDLPALTEQQCGEFIEIISTDSQSPESLPRTTIGPEIFEIKCSSRLNFWIRSCESKVWEQRLNPPGLLLSPVVL